MKISELIEYLQMTKDEEGDIEVTCTGCLQPDGWGLDGMPFESTVENFQICESENGGLNKRVRLWM